MEESKGARLADLGRPGVQEAFMAALGTEAGDEGIAHQYAQLLLGPALEAQGFRAVLSVSGTPLPGVFDFDPIPRCCEARGAVLGGAALGRRESTDVGGTEDCG